ncbi:probable RNA helicase armi [Glossina fuscipes]|uniref:Probable RNA helicase armi n=1 Tax=Glossina fuscipes TaxID=7396 RepID=A0A9C5ZJ25_9MUSC|nr:probable RNA helicase armi [Glossina fuscipes]KAI9576517.1 hypothetical protein GQX74_009574 [Glossina fuscipes]
MCTLYLITLTLKKKKTQENDSPSWYNPYEAKHVFLMTVKLYRKNIKPESIGIITPYIKQAEHMRKLFVDAYVEMPKIGTVEEFQGQERDIIIISTLRSDVEHIPSDARTVFKRRGEYHIQKPTLKLKSEEPQKQRESSKLKLLGYLMGSILIGVAGMAIYRYKY